MGRFDGAPSSAYAVFRKSFGIRQRKEKARRVGDRRQGAGRRGVGDRRRWACRAVRRRRGRRRRGMTNGKRGWTAAADIKISIINSRYWLFATAGWKELRHGRPIMHYCTTTPSWDRSRIIIIRGSDSITRCPWMPIMNTSISNWKSCIQTQKCEPCHPINKLSSHPSLQLRDFPLASSHNFTHTAESTSLAAV